MTDTMRPPPYRPRPKEGEEDRAPKLGEDELQFRDLVIRRILVTMGVGVFSGAALMTRELPGGGLPYVFPLSAVPSFVLWLITLLLATVWTGRKGRVRVLLLALAALAVASLLGVALRYTHGPASWWQDFWTRFG